MKLMLIFVLVILSTTGAFADSKPHADCYMMVCEKMGGSVHGGTGDCEKYSEIPSIRLYEEGNGTFTAIGHLGGVLSGLVKTVYSPYPGGDHVMFTVGPSNSTSFNDFFGYYLYNTTSKVTGQVAKRGSMVDGRYTDICYFLDKRL